MPQELLESGHSFRGRARRPTVDELGRERSVGSACISRGGSRHQRCCVHCFWKCRRCGSVALTKSVCRPSSFWRRRCGATCSACSRWCCCEAPTASWPPSILSRRRGLLVGEAGVDLIDNEKFECIGRAAGSAGQRPPAARCRRLPAAAGRPAICVGALRQIRRAAP